MRYDQDAFRREVARVPEIVDLAAQIFSGEHVKRAERLVEKEQFRIDDEGTREANALLHAAGQFLRIGTFEPVETDDVDRFESSLRAFRTSDTLRLETEFDVFKYGQPRQQRKGLEDHRNVGVRPMQRLTAARYHAARRRY